MNSKLVASCFVVASLLAPIAAHAADGDTDRNHPTTFVKDSVITTKVKAKLAEEKLASLESVRVDTDANGAVSLSGNVKSRDEADKAVSIARETEGVTSVKSTLKIKKEK